MNNKIVFSLMLIFLISAVSALSVEISQPNSTTTINSSTTNFDITFNLTDYNSEHSFTADIYYDIDTDPAEKTEIITGISITNPSETQTYIWDTTTVITDGNHYIYVQVREDVNSDNNGNNYSESFLIDKNPPETTATGFIDNEWNNTSITAILSCSDSGSDCNKTYYKYKLNDANFTEYTEYNLGIDFNSDGIYSMKFYSTDNAGNTETEKTAVIKIDSVSPTNITDLSASASGLTINLNWTAATDTNGSGIEKYFVFRDGTLLTTSGTNSYSDTGLTHNTTYTYYVIASDYADNNSSASNDANATAKDETGPSVSSNADSSWHKGTQTITLTCSDSDFDTLYYKINSTQFETTTNPKAVEISAEGENSLEFWAKDTYGNTGTHITATIKIDNSPPNAPSLSSPGANSNGEVSLSWSEPSDNPGTNSGVKGYKIYRKTGSESYSLITTINGKSNTSYTDTGRSQGTTYYYKVTAFDNLDQESDLSNSNEQQVTIPSDSGNTNTGDGVPPSVSWREPSDGDTIKDLNVTLKAFISDTSEIKFISFTYKKTSESSYHSIKSLQTNLFNGTKTTTWDTSGLENGEYNLKVLARDSPGNVNSKTITVTLDREGIVISVPDENADENKTELSLAETAIENAKQSRNESMDLINYWKKFNLDFSSDEKVKQAHLLLRKAEDELFEEKLTECIKDAEESKKLFDEFNQTEVNEYKTQAMDTENELNLSANLSNENEKLKKEVTTTREMQLIEVKYNGETYYQENFIVKVKNISEKVRNIQIIEVIPKELIESASLISSNYEFTVIEEDLVIKWEMELAAGETREIIYSLDSKLNKKETDKIIESEISFLGNSVVLDRKTKIDKDSFVPVTGLFLLEGLFPIGIAVLIIIVLVGSFLFLRSKGFSFGGTEKEEVSFEGLTGAYSRENFKTKRTLREEEIKQKKINPLGEGENGGRFSFKGD